MWNFFDGHPIIAIIVIGVFVAIAIPVIILLIKAAKSGNGVEAEAGKEGLKFKLGKKEVKSREEFEADIIRDAALLSSSIISWKNEVSKEIERKTNEVINNCVRYATSRIESAVGIAKLDYGNNLKKKKEELTQEDNYQITIYGFLVDLVKETLKDQICNAIRADHFEDKTEAEIKVIGENCYLLSKLVFEDKIQYLRKDIIDEIDEKYSNRIKKGADEIVELTAQKYRNLKKEIEETVITNEEKFRAELKIKFPKFTNEIIDQLVNYYS